MYDLDIREELRAAIAAEHRHDLDTVVVDELGLRQGQVRVDVAVVNGSLKGYEIKSPADSLRRLPRQVVVYSEVLDYAEIVLADAHREDALALVPSWWGVTIAWSDAGAVRLDRYREGRRNQEVNARSLAELLWHADALEILRARGAHRGLSGRPRADAWDRLVATCSPTEIADAVRAQLKARAQQRLGRSRT